MITMGLQTLTLGQQVERMNMSTNAPGTLIHYLKSSWKICSSFDQITKTFVLNLLPSILNNNSGCKSSNNCNEHSTIVTNSCSPSNLCVSVTFHCLLWYQSITPIPNQTTTNASFHHGTGNIYH
jgi:hypothetical protein